MEDALAVLVQALVRAPEAVRIERHDEERRVLLLVTVAAQDMGRVIGRQGRLAKAVRSVMRAVGERENLQVVVEFR